MFCVVCVSPSPPRIKKIKFQTLHGAELLESTASFEGKHQEEETPMRPRRAAASQWSQRNLTKQVKTLTQSKAKPILPRICSCF